MSNKLAVVGAAGFLGRTLVAHLTETGVKHQAFTRAAPAVIDGVASADLSQCSTVVWLASSINPLVAETNPEFVANDVADLTECIRVLEKMARPPRLVLLSSGGTVYGDGQAPFGEEDETRPTSAYGRAKLQLEEAAGAGAVEAVCVRVANAYGPGQPVARGQGVIAHWLRAIRRKEPVRLFGDPGTIRDYVFARDIAKALVAISEAERVPPALNVGSGQPTTLSELLHAILRVVEQETVVVEYAMSRSFDARANYLRTERIQQSTGWTPSTTLEAGLQQTWAAVNRFGDALP